MLAFTALNVLTVVTWGSAGLWLAGGAVTLWRLHLQKPVDAQKYAGSPPDSVAPFVSVLIPARNEENRVLRQCLHSILSQAYGKFEVITVNDRSTDGTGPILHAIARLDRRLQVVEGSEPPLGWLGKPHALQQALDASSGEWVLATDADMIYDAAALRTAVALALRGGFDAVTFIPHVECVSFWERVFMPIFGWFMMIVMPMDRVNDPKRSESLGVGGFFLIRRTALKRIDEYGAVRAEVAEDLRMSEALKRSGARLRIEYAPDLISTRMQTNLAEIWAGFTKNLFAGARFNLLQSAVAATCILFFAIAPFIVAVASGAMLALGMRSDATPLFFASIAVWLAQVSISVLINLSWKIPVLYSLTVPLGYALFLAILINSTWKIATGVGVMWKGRRLYERAGVSPPRTAYQVPDAHER